VSNQRYRAKLEIEQPAATSLSSGREAERIDPRHVFGLTRIDGALCRISFHRHRSLPTRRTEESALERGRDALGLPFDANPAGELHGVEIAFLPRHGPGHAIPRAT